MKWRLEWNDYQGKNHSVAGDDINDVFHQAVRLKTGWSNKLSDEKDFVKKLVNGLTDKVTERVESLSHNLEDAVRRNSAVDWEAWKDSSSYGEPPPVKPQLLSMAKGKEYSIDEFDSKQPPNPEFHEIPPEPRRTDKEFGEPQSTGEWVRSRLSTRYFDRKFETAHADWLRRKGNLEELNLTLATTNADRLAKWAKDCEILHHYHEQIRKWNDRKAEFYQKQRTNNEAIETLRASHRNSSPEILTLFFSKVLESLTFSFDYLRSVDVEYKEDQKLLVVDYLMPSISDLPSHKEIKYVQARDEITEVFLPERLLTELYDSVLYQIVLACLNGLFKSDESSALSIIVFNGWVKSIDKTNGNEINCCIMSVQVSRQEFALINLARVEPKSCFKALKGIGSSKLHSLTPVAPVMSMSREDKRFVDPYEVVDGLDESNNLAAMDWLDFENLIRELFEKEFSSNGGEVKITQASRDGGVDAIAFDPDPIRGGKMVIQAKRYTNVVGVSAVRDLYGTLINEGATKGILVTTSEYGPDAYEFAKGKPLALLNGGNLLSLLEKHGHHAKIDLKEAKRILGEQVR